MRFGFDALASSFHSDSIACKFESSVLFVSFVMNEVDGKKKDKETIERQELL
jgi:hypothetical protein